MGLEERIYDMPIEVKQVVISVQDYHVRRELMPMGAVFDSTYAPTAEQRIDQTKMAEQDAKHCLLDGIEKFIHCEVNEERNFVEATIWMPYVKDEVTKELEVSNKLLRSLNGRLESDCNTWRAKAEELWEYLELPWWKKLFRSYK